MLEPSPFPPAMNSCYTSLRPTAIHRSLECHDAFCFVAWSLRHVMTHRWCLCTFYETETLSQILYVTYNNERKTRTSALFPHIIIQFHVWTDKQNVILRVGLQSPERCVIKLDQVRRFFRSWYCTSCSINSPFLRTPNYQYRVHMM